MKSWAALVRFGPKDRTADGTLFRTHTRAEMATIVSMTDTILRPLRAPSRSRYRQPAPNTPLPNYTVITQSVTNGGSTQCPSGYQVLGGACLIYGGTPGGQWMQVGGNISGNGYACTFQSYTTGGEGPITVQDQATCYQPQPPPAPSAFSQNPINAGGGAAMYWNSTYADNVYINNYGWAGTSGACGSLLVLQQTIPALATRPRTDGEVSTALLSPSMKKPPPAPSPSSPQPLRIRIQRHAGHGLVVVFTCQQRIH